MASQTAGRRWTADRDGRPRFGAGALVGLVAAVLAACLVVLSMRSLMMAAIACGAAAFVTLLAALGATRVAVLTLMGAFATAPMYKGLAPSVDSQVTPTDLLFVIGFGLLLPVLVTKRVQLPGVYVVGVALLIVTGCVGSVFSVNPAGSFLMLVLWMMVLLGLPTAMALWLPSDRIVELLAWSYVAGHLVSTAYGLVQGPYVNDRYAGNATHPNYFAQAGMMSIALLFYLFFRYRHFWQRTAVLGAIGICGFSILISGSRAATVVVAGLVLMIPIVERSAIAGFVYALGGALFIIALPLIIGISGEESSIARLAGNTSAELADDARDEGLEAGLERFAEHPLRGSGLLELFDIHNNFLEVGVGLGIFGVLGYALVLFAFGRPIFGSGEHRRLGYAAWAYIGWGASVPSLVDRSVWAPVSLVMISMIGGTLRDRREEGILTTEAARPPEAARSPKGRA